MLSNDELAEKLKERPGQRVTQQQIEGRIKDTAYDVIETTTICRIKLDNGYQVIGTSACVDPVNYDKAIGEKIAYDNAFRQLWPLFGFLLAESRFQPGEARAA